MRKPGSIFMVAILIGALAAALVYRHLQDLQHQVQSARGTTTNKATVDVVVANGPIPTGSKIDESNVRTVAWPAELEPEGAIRDPKVIVGNIARTSIEKNEPVVQAALVPQGAGLLPMVISEGMRGMSVRVDDVTGVSGFITPNSRVDVLIAGNPDSTGGEGQRSKLVLQNIRVLATGKTIEQKDEKPVEVPTVTLLVSPEEAEKLTLATRYEPVRLALRNYRDEDLVNTPGVSTRMLFEGGEGQRAAVRVQAPNRPEPPAPYSVEILLGEKLTRQVL